MPNHSLPAPSARTALLVLWLGCAASSVAAAPAPERRHEAPGSTASRERQAPGQTEALRLERRNRHRAILEALWGSVSADPAAIAEFELHAWRMARLRRMERLATELDRAGLPDRIAKLIAKEQARHTKHLKRLADQSTAAPRTAAKVPPPPRKPARKD